MDVAADVDVKLVVAGVHIPVDVEGVEAVCVVIVVVVVVGRAVAVVTRIQTGLSYRPGIQISMQSLLKSTTICSGRG